MSDNDLKLSDLMDGDRPGEYRYPILLAGGAPANTFDRQRATSDRLRSIETLLCEGEIYAVFNADGTLFTTEAADGVPAFSGYEYFPDTKMKGENDDKAVWTPRQDGTFFDQEIPKEAQVVRVIPWIIDPMGDELSNLRNAYPQLMQGIMKLFTPGTAQHDCFKICSAIVDAQTMGEAMDGSRLVVVNDGSYDTLLEMLRNFVDIGTMTQEPGSIVTELRDDRRLSSAAQVIEQMFAPSIDVRKTASHPKFHMDKDEFLAVIDRNAELSPRVLTLFGSASIAEAWGLHDSMGLTMTVVDKGMSTIHGGGTVGIMATNSFGTLAAGGHSTGVNTPNIVALEGKPVCSDFSISDDIYIRMIEMFKKGGAVVVEPGGFGSLQEAEAALQIKNISRLIQHKAEHGLSLSEGQKKFADFWGDDQVEKFADVPVILLNRPIGPIHGETEVDPKFIVKKGVEGEKDEIQRVWDKYIEMLKERTTVDLSEERSITTDEPRYVTRQKPKEISCMDLVDVVDSWEEAVVVAEKHFDDKGMAKGKINPNQTRQPSEENISAVENLLMRAKEIDPSRFENDDKGTQEENAKADYDNANEALPRLLGFIDAEAEKGDNFFKLLQGQIRERLEAELGEYEKSGKRPSNYENLVARPAWKLESRKRVNERADEFKRTSSGPDSKGEELTSIAATTLGKPVDGKFNIDM